jgi:hypothetical protein
MTARHAIALRQPWYVGERAVPKYDRFDPRALRPTLQKYDATDFVDRLLADPQDSLEFDAEDVWSYPVLLPKLAPKGEGRLRFATHRYLRTGLRKLYQPSHDRFYTVVVELFCDTGGLPRPNQADLVEVGFVLRRRKITYNATVAEVRHQAAELAKQLLKKQQGLPGSMANDVTDVLSAEQAVDNALVPPDLVKEVVEQGWMVGPGGHARWRNIGSQMPAGLELHEDEISMWRLPATAADCPESTSRSLWFGVVPAFSSEHADSFDDPTVPGSHRKDKGTPKLDEHAIYQIRCFARRPPAPGHEHCPPQIWYSEPTEPFRLAPHFDAQGTANRSVSFSMPDFRSLAARASQPPGPGGVKITSPPGSQMSFPKNGSIPGPGTGSVDGNSPVVCTFAIELFTIVAFFVFSLFLPIVVLVLQLWWLLALRFCLPPAFKAMVLLDAHFSTGGTIATLPLPTVPTPVPETVSEKSLDEAFGMSGIATELKKPTSKFPMDASGDLVKKKPGGLIDPRDAATPKEPAHEPHVDDPLCEPGSNRTLGP